MDVQLLCSSQENEWDEYVQKSPQGAFCYLIGWKRVVEDVFGHQSCYLVARDAKKICGVLPLFYIRRNIFSGPSLISSPFATYGGILSDHSAATQALFDKARELAEKYNVDVMELRNTSPTELPLIGNDLYQTFIKKLPEQPDQVLPSLPRKARAATRNAIKAGFEGKFENNNLSEFFQLFSENKKALGSPTMPYRFFSRLYEEFPNQISLYFTRLDGRIVTAVMCFQYQKTFTVYYSGAIQQRFKHNPNNFMYYHVMQYAAKQGFHYFDFGRSRKNTGAANFKKNQGFTPQALHYQYYLRKGKKIPEINPGNKKFHLFQAMWRHLPLKVTQLIGPQLVKYLP